MPIVEFEKIIFSVDEDGFLENFGDWCPEWVEYIRTAQIIGVLTDEHWKLINVLQDNLTVHDSASPRLAVKARRNLSDFLLDRFLSPEVEIYTKLETCLIQVRSLLGAGKVLSNIPI